MLSFPGLRLRCLVPFVTPAAGPHQRHLLTHHQVIIRANTKQTDGSACTSSTPEPAKPGACGFDRAFRLLESSAILHALHGNKPRHYQHFQKACQHAGVPLRHVRRGFTTLGFLFAGSQIKILRTPDEFFDVLKVIKHPAYLQWAYSSPLHSIAS